MERGNMQEKLSRFLPKYHTTPHSTTGVPPAELLMKRRLRTRLDLMLPNNANVVRRKQGNQKEAHITRPNIGTLKLGILCSSRTSAPPSPARKEP